MLYRAGAERRAKLGQEIFAQRAIVARHADLDQFVALQIDVDFLQYRGAQALVADHHDRFERVGAGFQFAAAGRCEIQGCPMRSAWVSRSF